MKIERKNKLLQKMLIVMLTALILFNFIMPTVVKATDYDGEVSSLAGPIQSLIILIGDAGMSLMQYVFVGDWDVTTRMTNEGVIPEWAENIFAFLIPGGVFLDMLGDVKYIDVPNFQISPESIFQGKIPAFDINFFSPMSGIESSKTGVLESKKINMDGSEENLRTNISNNWNPYGFKDSEVVLVETEINDVQTIYTYEWTYNDVKYKMQAESDGPISISGGNFNCTVYGDVVEERESSAEILQSTVSYWYNQLRNISIIGLLSVLVYIGIRIVLSSVAADKSKYKEMLKDWVVAICLLFFMHYFMNFTVTITKSISDALDSDGMKTETTSEESSVSYDGDRLIGVIRLRLQTEEKLSARWAYTIIYLVIVIYTIIFAIMYLKRVIYMAFFTMMAPLVALTYPLDKVRDGKAQAFDMWMKEYTFNALIQPFHLIIYYVLVGSAIDLAVDNPLYALVAIGFMMPAEKLLRKFFGFNKSETSGVLGGAFGGAMIMQGINALQKRAGHPGGKKGPAGAEEKAKANNNSVRTADSGKNMNSLMDDYLTDKDATDENQSSTTTQPKLEGLTGEEMEEKQQLEDYFKNTPDDIRWESPEKQQEYQNNLDRLDELEKLEKDSQMAEQEDGNNNRNEENVDNTSETTEDNEEEKTHRLRAYASMGGRWLLKGTAGVGKLAVRGATAATLGTIGVAAGLASDDYSNVLKFGAAGLAAGNAVTGAGINRVKKLPSDAYRIKNAYEKEREKFEQDAYSAAERKRRANSRADNEFLNDKATIRLYKDKFNKDYAKAMQDALKYREYGITDNDTIIKAMNLKTEGLGGRTDKRRILVAGTAPSLGRKDIDSYGERLEKRGFGKQTEVMKKAVREFNDFE